MVDIPHSVTAYTDCSISTIHHTLQASRRRLVIGLVAHQVISSASPEQPRSQTKAQTRDIDSRISVRQIAKEIVTLEEDVPIENATGEAYHNVYTALIQTHLPKLDDVAAIEYNPNRKTVYPGENLLAFSMVTAITGPVTRLLFHDAVAKLHANESRSLSDSIND